MNPYREPPELVLTAEAECAIIFLAPDGSVLMCAKFPEKTLPFAEVRRRVFESAIQLGAYRG